jgi:subtilisin family serine protease
MAQQPPRKNRNSGGDGSPANEGRFIILNGKTLKLVHHPTDFSVINASSAVHAAKEKGRAKAQPLSAAITRVQAPDSTSRDDLMEEVRKETVAHHIYKVEETGEEIVIDNRIFLTLHQKDPELLEDIVQDYRLVSEGRMGNAYVLRVTEATGRNPLKVANEIAQREGVASCTPQLLVPMQRFQPTLSETHRFFALQWYLDSTMLSDSDLDPTASISVPEAWQITTGSPDIVIAVIDDGFDLNHPAFRDKRIHPARRDFAVFPTDDEPQPEQADYHGTCVASIATASADGDGMIGVAPGCTFLPIRIGFGPMAAQIDIRDVFRYVSLHADVVNCSFGTPPASFDYFSAAFRQEITTLTRTGGRRGKGLVMVFAAGNDDAPTLLRRSKNVNGVKFVQRGDIAEIPAGSDVFSGYPLTSGVIVVGAMSSRKRKAGYSSWGPHLTVTAPSNNLHYIPSFIRPGANDVIRNQFVANYRGLGQVAAVNRPGNGTGFSPLPDDLGTPNFAENFYTNRFGGTSGAAPIVTGTAALILSVNPHLTASQVRQILRSTADRDLDFTLDLTSDPNIQGLSGSFVNGQSLFFGAGKVNALRAVQRSRSLLTGPNFHALNNSHGGLRRLPKTGHLLRRQHNLDNLADRFLSPTLTPQQALGVTIDGINRLTSNPFQVSDSLGKIDIIFNDQDYLDLLGEALVDETGKVGFKIEREDLADLDSSWTVTKTAIRIRTYAVPAM